MIFCKLVQASDMQEISEMLRKIGSGFKLSEWIVEQKVDFKFNCSLVK